MTKNQFIHWLERAAVGAKLVYHQGYLPVDRYVDDNRPKSQKLGVSAFAALVLKNSNAGKVALVQKRKAFQSYDYIAIKRQVEPLKKPVFRRHLELA